MFRERLLILIEEKNMDFAKISRESGISKSTIDSWYRGNRIPNANGITKLCKYFDVSADWLLGLSNFRRLKK